MKRKINDQKNVTEEDLPQSKRQPQEKNDQKKEDETATLKMLSVITTAATEKENNDNLLNIELNEIFSKCSITKKKQNKIEGWLNKFRQYLKGLDSDQPIKVEVPNFLPEGIENFPLKSCHPPSNIHLVSSYLQNAQFTSNSIDIEICLEIPKLCVFPKDTINYKYFCRRREYLAKVTSYLLKSELISNLFWDLENCVTYRPILIIEPNELQKVRFIMKTVVHKETQWNCSRFLPNSSNVRLDYFNKTGEELPTSFYNNNLGLEKFYYESRVNLQESLATSEIALKGCILLKIWLRNRFLNVGFGSFNDHIAECFAVYILRKEGSFLSPLHFFKIAMKLIGENFFDTPRSLKDNFKENFGKQFDIVLLDNYSINLCAHWHKNVNDRLKYEADIALNLIENYQEYQSDLVVNLFGQEILPELVYDQIIHFKKYPPVESDLSSCCTAFSIIPKMINILEKAIGRRISCIVPYSRKIAPWKVTAQASENFFSIGIILNLQHAFEILEKGPSADSKDAKIFRNFWGEKSEMRKFQDTSICEAVVFPADNMAQKRKIVTKMIKYILQRHMKISLNDVKVLPNSIDNLITDDEIGTGEEKLTSLSLSFDNFSKMLRKASHDLPLPMQAIHGIHPAIRMTSLNSSPEVVNVLCLLETSGKWPEDIDAIKRLKVAYLLELRKKLRMSNYDAELSMNFLDVTFDNIKFRIYVGQTGEITILKMTKTKTGLIKFLDNEESLEAQKNLIVKPLFVSMIKGLQQEHPVFCLTVRIIKKWLETQMISLYFEEEAIELIVAHIFKRKYRFNPPNSSRVAFLRFLELIAHFDWKTSGLVVNIDGNLNNTEMEGMQKEIRKCRKTLPGLVLSWVGDKKGTIFTKNTPDFIVRHFVTLAKKSVELLTNSYSDLEILFRPDMSIFDVILSMKRSISNETIAKFVNRINMAYKSNAIFFCDRDDGSKIGGIWKPSSKTRSFSIAHCQYANPSWDKEGKIKLSVDMEVIKEDLKILGKDLINSIDIVRPMT